MKDGILLKKNLIEVGKLLYFIALALCCLISPFISFENNGICFIGSGSLNSKLANSAIIAGIFSKYYISFKHLSVMMSSGV
jgi:hypothetical protein